MTLTPIHVNTPCINGHRRFLRARKTIVRATDRRVTRTGLDKRWLKFSLSRKLNPLPFFSKRYKSNPQIEIARLAKNILFSGFVNREADRGLKRITFGDDTSTLVTFGRCLEVAESFKAAGYYVFTHGQSVSAALVSDLLTKAQATSDPNHRMWRLKNDPIKWKNIDEYRNSPEFGQNDDDLKSSLLSVDGLLNRDENYESAYSFFSGNLSMSCPSLHKIILNVLNLTEIPTELANEIADFSRWMSKNITFGRLNLIAIPKDLLKDPSTCFVYRSHPYGVECFHEENTHATFIDVLERHQQGHTSACDAQYRILIHPLQENMAVKTCAFSSVAKSLQTEYSRRLDAILARIA